MKLFHYFRLLVGLLALCLGWASTSQAAISASDGLAFAGPNGRSSNNSALKRTIKASVTSGSSAFGNINLVEDTCGGVSGSLSITVTGTTNDGGGSDAVWFSIWDDGTEMFGQQINVPVGQTTTTLVNISYPGAVGTAAPGIGLDLGDAPGIGDLATIDSYYPTQISGCVIAQPPSCTLTASPASISLGESSTLTASCSPMAYSYSWSGTCAWNTSDTCTVTPSATTEYTVAGFNEAGMGYPATAVVTVAMVSPPTCTLTASPPTISPGDYSILTASCSPAAYSYSWTGGTCAWSTGSTCTVSPLDTTTYSVTGANAAGYSSAASASVTVTAAPSTFSNVSLVEDTCGGVSGSLSITVTGTTNDGGGSDAVWFSIWDDGTQMFGQQINVPVGQTTTTLVNISYPGAVGTAAPGIGLDLGDAPGIGDLATIDPYYPTQISGCVIAQPPNCTLTASPASISLGESSTLTASCSPEATSYNWVGGTCAGETTNTCTVTPGSSTTYTVTGMNATGAGISASSTVTVTTALTPPACSLSQMPYGSKISLSANCTPAATSYIWSANTGFASAASGGLIDPPTVTTTYTVQGVNAAGAGNASALTITPAAPDKPACALTASPPSIAQGDSSTLTASCSPAAHSYNWSTNAGCDATSASCTVAPAETEIYTVTGSNTSGTGASVAVVVYVAQPTPACTLTYSSGSQVSGKTGTLTASCSPAAMSYTWSDASCSPSSATCAVAPTVTTTYTVTGNNAGGTGSAASVTVTAAKHLLAVTLPGTGYGNVASSPGGVSCYAPEPNINYLVAPDCSESYASGIAVTLTATPASGSTFFGWSGACSGTASCVVTMNAAKSVTATFKTAPFVATTVKDITPTSATISTTVSFAPADVGKTGAVYITAWAPASGLTALGILAAPMSHAMSVTTTRDNPYTGGKINTRQETLATLLAAADPNAFVLVQLTSTGWQLVQNGQLIPYASGVLGDQMAALSILNNANPSNLLGAQFCVGYGTTAAEMVASGRMMPVADIPGGTVATNGSCNVAANPYKGLWYNASESGWGMSVTQHDTINFVAMYTYDQSTQPVWYVMSNCPIVAAGSCTGDIYKVVGGKSPTQPWVALDFAQALSTVGSGTLTFSDTNNGKFDFTLNGVAGSKTIERQQFSSGTAAQAVDYSDLWWNAAESGWGVALTQDVGMIFATWYTYDAAGMPVWYVASSCPLSGSGCTGDVYKVTGGMPLSASWVNLDFTKALSKVGTVTFAFSDSSTGTMSYTINGVAGSKAIVRQAF